MKKWTYGRSRVSKPVPFDNGHARTRWKASALAVSVTLEITSLLSVSTSRELNSNGSGVDGTDWFDSKGVAV